MDIEVTYCNIYQWKDPTLLILVELFLIVDYKLRVILYVLLCTFLEPN